jgi:hypothetical protein
MNLFRGLRVRSCRSPPGVLPRLRLLPGRRPRRFLKVQDSLRYQTNDASTPDPLPEAEGAVLAEARYWLTVTGEGDLGNTLAPGSTEPTMDGKPDGMELWLKLAVRSAVRRR